MYTIQKAATGSIWPFEELLGEFEDPGIGRGDFGGLVSTILVEAMLGHDTFQIGDSPVCLCVTGTKAKKGTESVEEMREASAALAVLIESAVCQMADPRMLAYYRYYLDDFKANGVEMPFFGKLL